MAKRIKIDELLRLACLYAEQDRDSWLQAMEPCRNSPDDKEAIAFAEQFLEQLRAYRRKRWGKSRGDIIDETAVPMQVYEVIAEGIVKGELPCR